jgi:hypothetical protein
MGNDVAGRIAQSGHRPVSAVPDDERDALFGTHRRDGEAGDQHHNETSQPKQYHCTRV